MNIQTPFTLASVYPLGVWRSLGLRLHGLCQFQASLASGPCAASASSYCFRSPRPVRSLSFLRFGSNPALKPTRILRADLSFSLVHSICRPITYNYQR
ncbi:DUF1010 domain-containing protein [Comamonas aquatica]|uniref:DUF1010 domain-containing protein n=1 Tax=Comamonas aquatica TaxID=225991 RepID=UPI0036F1A89F